MGSNLSYFKLIGSVFVCFFTNFKTSKYLDFFSGPYLQIIVSSNIVGSSNLSSQANVLVSNPPATIRSLVPEIPIALYSFTNGNIIHLSLDSE